MDERKVIVGSGLSSIYRHLIELAANRMEQGERIVVSIPRKNGMEELEKQFNQFREVKMNRAERRSSERKKRRK
ncbi:hypothetical protein HQN89_10715 [Paenibacillus frigoriresistens]|uniref:hypothetical protein n=1 Tax=Paenibacillus alginolyticus TaxID=59839 RepID=UPI001567B91E|nr:hypothetical protein [Paenibacillus frigoriresistens]NRF91491.1 hypothetical protein [Paenibacillus frigoriresistens]